MNTEIENTDSENTEIASTESTEIEDTESASAESENAEVAGTESENAESASTESEKAEIENAEVASTESENAESETTEETPVEAASQDAPVAEEQSSDTTDTSIAPTPSETEESIDETPTEVAPQDAPVAEEQSSDTTDTSIAPATSDTNESEVQENDTSAPKSIFQDAPMPPLPEHPSLAKKDENALQEHEREGDDAEAQAHSTSSLGHPGMFAGDNDSVSFPSGERKTDDDAQSVDGERDGNFFARGHERYPRRRNRSRYRYRIDKEQFAQMTIDYKNPEVLRRFITETGAILPRRVTGISATQQRKVVHAIKRARFLALLPMG